MDIVGESMDKMLTYDSNPIETPPEDVYDLSEEDNDSFHDSVEQDKEE